MKMFVSTAYQATLPNFFVAAHLIIARALRAGEKKPLTKSGFLRAMTGD